MKPEPLKWTKEDLAHLKLIFETNVNHELILNSIKVKEKSAVEWLKKWQHCTVCNGTPKKDCQANNHCIIVPYEKIDEAFEGVVRK